MGFLGLGGKTDDEKAVERYIRDTLAAAAAKEAQGPAPRPDDTYFGGYQEGANDWSKIGLQGMADSGAIGGWATGQAQGYRGAMASENQQLSDQEAYSRGYHQNGALQLASEAAMGQAPSEAAYQMQYGLDQGLAAQQAQMGSARGNAGIALASGNAAANSANMMNQTYMQAGQLRAAEMAQARGLYGGLSGQQREQDQSRLQQGSQMSQFNAGLNDQYSLGMGNLANQASQNQLGWYGQAGTGYEGNANRGANILTGNQSAAGANKELALGAHAAGLEREDDQNKAKLGTAVAVGKVVAGSVA